MHPIPLEPRTAPPVMADARDTGQPAEGEFVLSDVRWSLLPLPPDRPIRQLRVFQVLPKETTHIANRPRIGYANAESARMLLAPRPIPPVIPDAREATADPEGEFVLADVWWSLLGLPADRPLRPGPLRQPGVAVPRSADFGDASDPVRTADRPPEHGRRCLV